MSAGGFGDGSDLNAKCKSTGASKIAQLNLIGHAALIASLRKQKLLKKDATIVAAGSEACFATPGPFLDFYEADFHAHLTGTAIMVGPGAPYPWIKGILALYWSAFARRNPDLHVVTVSPGAVKNTNFYRGGGVSWALKHLSQMFVACMGSNSVQDGASKFTDILLLQSNDEKPESGSFLAHRIGYNQDFGNVGAHKRQERRRFPRRSNARSSMEDS